MDKALKNGADRAAGDPGKPARERAGNAELRNEIETAEASLKAAEARLKVQQVRENSLGAVIDRLEDKVARLKVELARLENGRQEEMASRALLRAQPQQGQRKTIGKIGFDPAESARHVLPAGAVARSATTHDVQVVMRSGMFDPATYREGLARLGVEAPRGGRWRLARHYIEDGWRHGVDPHPMFHTLWWRLRYHAGRVLQTCPLLEFLTASRTEDRDPHPLFSSSWYRARYTDIGAWRGSAWEHFLKCGQQEGRQPHPLFRPDYYLGTYQDLAGISVSGFEHFLRDGGREGRKPHPMFDPDWYVRRYGQEGLYDENPIIDLVLSAFEEERNPNLVFESEWYRSQHGVERSMTALAHFVLHGEKAGAEPGRLFDSEFYRERQRIPDTVSALEHFVLCGPASNVRTHRLFQPEFYAASRSGEKFSDGALDAYLKEGDRIGAAPHPLFDPAWYLSRNPEFVSLQSTALVDYLDRPNDTKPQPGPYFDPAWYLAGNSDVRDNDTDPLTHYVARGDAEGRQPNPLFNPDWFRRQYPDLCARYETTLEAYDANARSAEVEPHPVFNSAFYLQQVGGVLALGRTPLADYLSRLSVEGADCCPHFDASWYAETYPEAMIGYRDPLAEYMDRGWKAGRIPNRYFDVKWYARQYGVRPEDLHNPLVHFCMFGEARGLSYNPLLDPLWYKSVTPDAENYPGGALAHFLRVGDERGYSPTPLLDVQYYIQNCPSPPARGESVFRHYLNLGYRLGSPPNRWFDPDWYAARAPDLPPDYSPLQHYIEYGEQEGRMPGPRFDPVKARSQQRALLAAGNGGEGAWEPARSAAVSIPLKAPQSVRYLVICMGADELGWLEKFRPELEKLPADVQVLPLVDEPIGQSGTDPKSRSTTIVDMSSFDIDERWVFVRSRFDLRQQLALMLAQQLAARPDCRAVATLFAPPENLDDAMRLFGQLKSSGGVVAVHRGRLKGFGIRPFSSVLRQIEQLTRTLERETTEPLGAGLSPEGEEPQHNLGRWPGNWKRIYVSRAFANVSEADDSWRYARFANGAPVSPAHREAYRRHSELRTRFATPYQTSSGSFFEWCVKHSLRKPDGGLDVAITSTPVELAKHVIAEGGSIH